MEQIPSRIEIQDWLENLYPFVCYITGEKITNLQIEIDHKIPISRGGSLTLDNVAVTSRKVNLQKGNMTLKEYLELSELLSSWENEGQFLLDRLRASNNIYRK